MSFEFLFNAFGSVLSMLYDIRASYAWTIIGLTMLVMIIVTPLTLKATRSMLMMQQLQPEMKRIQSQFKDDRQKLNEELLKFYRENNINPVGGCLPLLVQMPIFLVLYQVLRGLTLRVPTVGSNVGWASGETGARLPLTKPPDIVHNFDPQYLPQGSALQESLSNSTTMHSLGLDLSASASQVFQQSLVAAIPYFILIAVVAVSGVVQQRQIQGRNPNAQINPQQQMIMKVMPFFLPVFSFALPSGLVLYFAVSNLYRVGQQWFIGRTIYGHTKTEGASLLDRFRGGRGRDEDVEKPVGKKSVGKTERPAKTTATKRPAAKEQGTEVAVTDERSSRSSRTGGATTAGKSKTPARTKNATGTSSNRTTPSKKTTTATRDSAERPQPTLQPRARKNKKR